MSLCHTVVVGKYIHTYRPSILIVAKVMRRSVYKRPPFRTVLNSSFPQPLILLFTTVVHKKRQFILPKYIFVIFPKIVVKQTNYNYYLLSLSLVAQFKE